MPDLFEWSPIREATFYEALGERKVRCMACAHYCIIHDGLRGICGGRGNRGGRLYSLVHGKGGKLWRPSSTPSTSISRASAIRTIGESAARSCSRYWTPSSAACERACG